MRFLNSAISALAVLTLCAALPSLTAQPTWSVVRTLNVGGEGGWDYLTADPPNHRLFVARSTHVQVVDTETGTLLADITGLEEAHGIVIEPSLNRGFITDGGGKGAIVLFDLKTYKVLGRLAALPDVDAITYNPADGLILVSAGDSNALVTFHPDVNLATGAIDPPIKLAGSPEALRSDGDGKVYINLSDKNAVAVVDLKARKVVAQWPVAPGGHPVAMAIDTAARKLFIGCRNPQKLVVINADNGHIDASFPLGEGVDGAAFANGQAFASCAEGVLAVVGSGSGEYAIDQTLTTRKGSRTFAVDEVNHRIYLPAGEFTPAAKGWPKLNLGTFVILVLQTP